MNRALLSELKKPKTISYFAMINPVEQNQLFQFQLQTQIPH